MHHDPDSDPLSSLLAMLRTRTRGSPIASVVNETTINLTCKLLSRDPKDYVNIAEHISNNLDVEILLDFMLHLLCEHRLSNPAGDINLRARHLMLKVATRASVVPRSLMVAGVNIRSERDLIGSGGFGHVFKGELLGAPVALKVLHNTNHSIDFRREALMWRSLNHNLVLPFLGIYETKSASFLVSPYMKNGTLVQWRKKANPSIAEIQERILEVAQGVEYIHSEGVVHGDLRGDNILLDADLHVKIADFGLTRILGATATRSGALHLNFAAPELFGSFLDDASDDVPARTQKSDVYAFGCFYYEIHYDTVPFAGKQELQILRLVSQGARPPRLDGPPVSNEAWDLIQRCWVSDPSKRPAMKDIADGIMAILGHPLLSLLSILRENKPISAANTTSVDILLNLLTRQDYIDAAEKLNNPSDISNMLEFILFVLRNHYFSNPDHNVDTNRRARRLMSKIISKSPVIPRSLFLTGLTMPSDRNLIGGGGFGLVFKGEHEGKAIALKVLYKTRNNVDFCREALMWRSLHHKFVLPFWGIYENEASSQFFLVSPYMTNGTLAQWRKRAVPPLSEIEMRLLEVARGVHYIHSEGIVHGDLRGANILLDDEFHAQITDFGLTRHSEATVTRSGALHFNFAAPELIGYTEDDTDDSENSTARTQQSDVYAFGCLYYEIHYGAIPFEGLGALPIIKAVSRGERPPRLDNPPLSEDAWKLMHQCWAHDKRLRPDIRDVVKIIKLWKKWKPPALVNGSTSPLIRKRSSKWSFHSGDDVPETPPLPFRVPPVRPKSSREEDAVKMSIAIDFGTTFSGVAYGSTRTTGGKIQQILRWPGTLETFTKIPTCLIYDRDGRVHSWGLEAKEGQLPVGFMRCEWFKLYLEPRNLHKGLAADPRLPRLPPGKEAIDVITDFLQCLWQYAKAWITEDIGAVADLDSAEMSLVVPATWDKRGCDIIHTAAIRAGLVESENSHYISRSQDRLHIITEPEAAAVHCPVDQLTPSQNFMIAYASEGTCDFTIYKLIGQMTGLEIAEICARSGVNCGSIFLDLRFRELVKCILSDHPAHLDPASLANFIHSFKTDKMEYRGRADDNTLFHFSCFNTVDQDDSSVGLMGGQLCIPGSLLRTYVFDPVVDQVLTLVEEQMNRVEEPIHALFLVGGFAESEYLKQRVEEGFASRIGVIVRPPCADSAALRGAAQYGLSKRQLMSFAIAPRSYMIEVNLPAEQEDHMKRPAYIVKNDAGVTICQKRLQYLLVKGSVLRKRQRSTATFRKVSQNLQDSTFVTTIYSSERKETSRYIDENGVTEVRKWIIDISSLPSFIQNASTHEGGFYTEFEVGLEFDSAEMRGILLYKNEEWERNSTILDSY